MEIRCPRCNSDDVTLSRRSRFFGRGQFFPGVATPYRCRQCWSRFWAMGPGLKAVLSKKTAVLLILILTVLFFGWSYGQKKPRPEEHAKVDNLVVFKPLIRAAAGPEPGRLPDRAYDSGRTPDPGEGAAGQADEPELSAPAAIPARAGEADKGLAGPHTLVGIETQEFNAEFQMILLADHPIDTFQTFFLDAPPRFVIDLPGQWQNRGASRLTLSSARVQTIRVAEHEDKLRVVLDLRAERPLTPVAAASARGLGLKLK